MLGQNVHGPVELIEPEILGFRQPHPIKPALVTGELRARPIQPLGGHRQQGGLMRCLQLLLTYLLLDRGPNTKLLPHGFGDMDNAEIMNPFNEDVGNLNRLAAGGDLINPPIDQDPTNALCQALQDIAVEVIGTAETMNNLGLGSLRLGVPDILRQGVIFDRGAVAVLAFGAAKIHI